MHIVIFYIKKTILFSLLLLPLEAQPQSLKLSKSGPKTAIVISPEASVVCQKAAIELQKYIKKSMGIDIPIETKTNASQRIYIGQGEYIKAVASEVNLSGLGSDGYTILTKRNRLILAGGSGRGPLYAVYTFLENYLKCRLYAPDVMKVPTNTTLILNNIKITEAPKLMLRDVFYRPALDTLYADWHKLVYARFHQPLFGSFAHTGFQILPPDKYFKQHPEYYSLVNGKRQPFQLDYTNEEVYEIISGWLNAKMKNQPQFNIWSVSIEDNGHFCQCENCAKIIQKTGSPSGPVVLFANRIAQLFPGKTISTLAYTFVRKPPINISLAPNLNIMYCSLINSYPGRYTDASYMDMQKQLSGWQKLTKNIFVWDYVIDFSAIMNIYPNLLLLKPNINFFISNGAKGYFAQGNFYQDGEFAELRTYLLAKLLWKPDANEMEIMDDFLSGFYGDAAVPLKEYILLTSRQLAGGGDKLTYNLIDRLNTLFQRAENAVNTQPVFLKRVQREKVALQYTAVQFYLKEAADRPEQFFKDSRNTLNFSNYLEGFWESAKKLGLKRIVHNENNLPLYQFYTEWKNGMSKSRSKYSSGKK